MSASSSLFGRLRKHAVRWYTLVMVIANPYRPELHYMRGPGPKCRAKQRAPARVGAA
jgi:hypothetical protein